MFLNSVTSRDKTLPGERFVNKSDLVETFRKSNRIILQEVEFFSVF